MHQDENKMNNSIKWISSVLETLSKRAKIVPYRDSKPTYLFSHAFGGNWNTAVIGTISPASGLCDETLNTLNFISKHKNILNYPEQNVNDKYGFLTQIWIIYNYMMKNKDLMKTIDPIKFYHKEEITLSQSPKEICILLLDHIKSLKYKPDAFKILGAFEPTQKGWEISTTKFIDVLESLSKSFIKLCKIDINCLLETIISRSMKNTDINAIDYQLKAIDIEYRILIDHNISNIPSCAIYAINKCLNEYESKLNELSTILLKEVLHSPLKLESDYIDSAKLLKQIVDIMIKSLNLLEIEDWDLLKQLENLEISI